MKTIFEIIGTLFSEAFVILRQNINERISKEVIYGQNHSSARLINPTIRIF